MGADEYGCVFVVNKLLLGRWVCVVGVLSVLTGCLFPNEVVLAPVVARTDFAGERVWPGKGLDLLFAGGLDVPKRSWSAVACHVRRGASSGFARGASAVVVSRPGYVRVAEMLDEGLVEREFVERIEPYLAQPVVPSLEQLTELVVAQPPDDEGFVVEAVDVERYVQLRAEPPSEASMGRFVVYAHGVGSASTQQLVWLDVDAYWENATRRPGIEKFQFLRIAGHEPIELDGVSCAPPPTTTTTTTPANNNVSP